MEKDGTFKSYFPDIEFPTGNFISQLIRCWHKWEHLTALVCGHTEEELTYKELLSQVEKWCGYFSAKHPKQTPIGMVSPSTVEAAVCIIGMMAAGMTYCGICEEESIDAIVQQLKKLNIHDVIIHKSYQRKMEQAIIRIEGKFTKIYLGCGSFPMEKNIIFSDVLNDDIISSMKPVNVDDVQPLMIVQKRSGTSEVPTHIAISHRGFTSNLEVLSMPMWNSLHQTTDDYQAVSFAHRTFKDPFGLFLILFCGLRLGHKMIVKNYEEGKILEDLEHFQISRLHAQPFMFKTLLKIPTKRPKILTHLKSIMSSGSPLPNSLVTEFNEKLPGLNLQNCLRMNETLVTAMHPVNGWKYGTVGAIMNNVQVRVYGLETGEFLPMKCKGEILYRTPSIFTEYVNDPEGTAMVRTSDGWYHSGDIGMVDENNHLVIFDRIKQLIKPALQPPVYPAQIEDVLMEHPKVLDVAVVGVSHPKCVEAPRAFVALEDSSTSDEDLHQLIAGKLPLNNQLKGGIVHVESLPYTIAGKVDKLSLIKMNN